MLAQTDTLPDPVLHQRLLSGMECLALISLARLFGVQAAQTEPSEGIAVIVQVEGERFVLLVEQQSGQHQVAGISGAPGAEAPDQLTSRGACICELFISRGRVCQAPRISSISEWTSCRASRSLWALMWNRRRVT